MEKIPSHPILKFHSDTFEFIRHEYNLDKPGQMDAAVDILDDWVRKQAHFTKKEFPRGYLERSIILNKGSVERAKNQMDRLFTMKTAGPQYFEKTDAGHKEFERLHEYYVDSLLPKLTNDHYRIYAGKTFKNGYTTNMFLLSFQFGSLLFEHVRSNDYCNGFIGILDYRNISLTDLVGQINLSQMHEYFSIIMEGYKMRVKGIHFLTSSKAIELLVRIFKQILSKKIGDRITVHMNVESLHEYVPKELLPEEFGGEQKSLVEQNRDWVTELSKNENLEHFKDMFQAKVNEKLRNGNSKPNNDLSGMSGAFKTLNID